MSSVRTLCAFVVALSSVSLATHTQAFCGFYVAKADAQLFNQASTVVIARKGNNTVVTMAADYQGDAADFALVVPVPEVLQEGQVHVAPMALVDQLDAFTAPRLVEYFDSDLCAPEIVYSTMARSASLEDQIASQPAVNLGVTIEAQYQVEEYDIIILSAEQSDGLQTWLDSNGYQVPAKARRVLGSYIKQGMKFFVAKINIEEQHRLGVQQLRPLQMAFSSPRFMLPIRLGTVNAQNNNHAVMLEYAWNMTSCDPCAAEPLSNSQLRHLGAYWLPKQGPNNTFVTRLHLRYSAHTFPEDLMLQETGDRSNFQGRYILRHPWQGNRYACTKASTYIASLPATFEHQTKNLARLTGWHINDIRQSMSDHGQISQADDHAFKPTAWW
jgi:hypothetical protein